MGPKKSKTTKASLKKAGTMAATAAVRNKKRFFIYLFFDLIIQAGQEFLKQAWGEDKLKKVNELLEARDKSDTDTEGETSAPVNTTDATASSSASTKSKAKPSLSKARTMKNTAKVC
jgi:hypothetical protein